MKTIAFFNNKGGVGKTSLVYHLAWMLSEQNYRVIAADLDPQANLSGMFLSEDRLTDIWEKNNARSLNEDIAPIFAGVGDIADNPHIEKIGERIGLLVGDLALSQREDEFSTQWPKCLDGDERAFRVISVFARLIANAHKEFHADIALIDVGPNLGAINRAALIASDYVIIPLAPDLFSLQGLRNVGPTLRQWRKEWQDRINRSPDNLNIDLPPSAMQALGYIIMRHSIHLSRPVKAYARWIERMPAEYRKSILSNAKTRPATIDTDEHRLAHLKDYHSLMPLAQEANKPMFLLKPADGAIGVQQSAVTRCYGDFETLAKNIMQQMPE